MEALKGRSPKVAKKADKGSRLTPSDFAQVMSLTTEKRLAKTHEIRPPRILELRDMTEKFSSLDVDQAMFQPYPSEIVFQKYTPLKTYEVPLVLRNNDKIPRWVKVVMEESFFFRVTSTADVCRKVAPGMASTFTVVFTPQENKDYNQRLICVTEREKFEVAIRAIGARAILDFPDQVHFPVCPVKCLSQKTLLVRNIGDCEAKFQLRTSGSFSVDPPLGTLGVGDSMQVTVDFLPKKSGDHSEDLILHYHSGEDIYISLYGASADANVRLERNSVMMEKTYISLSSQRSVTIVNRSDTIVHFHWKGCADEEEEQKQRLCSELQQEAGDEMDDFLTECGADPATRDHLSLLYRTFQERRRQLCPEILSFSDSHIIMHPLEGDIWPNTTAEVQIIFKPQEAKLYQQTVYCDITGRESRLPLRIKGEGVGPKLQFNFELLDMGKIFIGSKHSYEVLLTNKGLIDASFMLEPPSTALGLCFSFTPTEGMVPPGACHALEVCFSANTLGVFTEVFHFIALGNPQPFTLTFRGCVIGPTFHFSVPKLNFGDVSFGFPHTLTCRLNNTSLVPMTFNLRIPGDSSGQPSLTSAELVSDLNRTNWVVGDWLRDYPTEFTLTPSSGTIRAQSQVDIQVTLCSNTERCYSLAVVVDVQGVGEDILALPISARCVVPDVILETPVLDIQRCFLGYPCHMSVKLVNSSDLPACYGLLNQEYEENPSLLYSSAHPRGVAGPHSTTEIPLVLQAKVLGRLEKTSHVAILGSQKPPLPLLLRCVGEGPEVLISSLGLDFGTIPVLTDVSSILQLSNRSPIPARFNAQMARRRSLWRVEPSEGEIPAEGVQEIHLVAHLDDTLTFLDKLQLSIQDSQTHVIPLTATGKGTTIVTNRPFAPVLNLGAHFSSGPCEYHIRVTNRGRRFHQLYWHTEGFAQLRRRPHVSNRSSRQGKVLSATAPPDAEPPVFSVNPSRVGLAPGQSADVVLLGSSNIPKVVQERLVCNAIVGHQTEKEPIMTVDVTCHFVAPDLEISTHQLSFYVEKAPGVLLLPLYERLVLKSVSSLTLSLQLTLPEPFGLCDHSSDNRYVTSKHLVLGVGAQTELWVRFDPSYCNDRISQVTEEVLEVRYLDHPHRDMVSLKGEVHFPNLHFPSTTVDFGCILNYTKAQHQMTMTNCSPLPVSYHWAFLVDHQQYHVRFVEDAGQTESCPAVGEVARDQQQQQSDWSHKTPADSRIDPDSEIDVPKAILEEEPVGEKEDSVNETKEGRGNLKEPVLSPVIRIPTAEGGLAPTREFNRSSPAQSPPSTEQDPDLPSRMSRERPNVGVEEVFDILPFYGVLKPGESQLVSFSFFGHADISGQVLALCEVEEGPIYEITLKGEASLVTYALDRTDIDLGLQLFDRVAEAELAVMNTGRLGFNFSILLGEQDESAKDPRPGQLQVIPSMGYVEAKTTTTLRICYLPGIPGVFHKTFLLQVAIFEPESIALRGEGIFPRVCLDLPRDLDEVKFSSMLKSARECVESEKLKDSPAEQREGTEEECIPTYDAMLQMEVERLLVKEYAMTTAETIYGDSRATSGSANKWNRTLNKFLLPQYVLDFGYVIHGHVPSHIVKVTNTGLVSVSFQADHSLLTGTGFSTELDRVKNLPWGETETFEVKFDPRGANLDLGEISTVMAIQVLRGPTVPVSLHAVVTMPTLTISTDALQFDSIQCGLCQVITVQVHNPGPVPCEWSVAEEERSSKKADKHTPLYLRKKIKFEQPSPPVVFEMLPSSGVLYPGERVNVQVKFSPVEGKTYSQRLVLTVAQSTHRVLLLAQGHGEEPQLEFATSLLELGPTLPHSMEEVAEVVVRNPCSFPIEFYSLEFDKLYLEEEKVLRMMKDYDVQNVLLLPPRSPGDTLPPELLEYYREYSGHESDSRASPKEETIEGGGEEEVTFLPAEESKDEVGAAASIGDSLSGDVKQGTVNSNYKVGELEVNPVSRAIARHMGIDLSAEGQAAKNRRGIAIIVYGAPLSGKTMAAVTLAKRYGAACLRVDAVVQEAVSSGASPAALQARELCARAELELAQKKMEECGEAVTDMMAPNADLSMEAVAKHTAEDGSANNPKAAPSSVSIRTKPSIVEARRNQGSLPTSISQTRKPQRLPSVSVSQGPESGLSPSILPEELLVDILTERLQLSDCYRGVVIDGLESVYSRSLSSTLQIILKAFNNRRFIYAVNLFNSYSAFKVKEEAKTKEAESMLWENEEKEKLRLLEMDEEEYDALPEEERERINLLHLEITRKRRQREQQQAKEETKRQQEELGRQREEEELRKKKKKNKKEDNAEKRSQAGGKQSVTGMYPDAKLDQQDSLPSNCTDSKEAKDSPTEGIREPEEGSRKKKHSEGREGKPEEQEEREHQEREQLGEDDRQLQSRFLLYDQSQPQILHILGFWDRTQGILLHPPILEQHSVQDTEDATTGRRGPSGKGVKKREVEKDWQEKEGTSVPPQTITSGESAERSEGVLDSVPLVSIDVTGRDHPSSAELLQHEMLPPVEEVLDGLGLGPKGPPIPPPMIFSVVPCPKMRPVATNQNILSCFSLKGPSSVDRKKTDLDNESQGPVTEPKEGLVTPTKGQDKSKAEKDPGRESQKDRRRTQAKRGIRGSPTPSAVTQLSDLDRGSHTGDGQQEHTQRLNTFRWTVPAKGEVIMKLSFQSSLPGRFDQTLNFELVATKRTYQLFCRGVCAFPSISQNYKTVFAHSKKALQSNESLQKTYIIPSDTYQFGPILYGKTRDRYKEGNFPENMERLVIQNDSPLDAEAHFSFQNDTKGSTYLLDPPNVILKPNEKQDLVIWAYPTTSGLFKDNLICCIKENPEPVVFRFSCQGVQPEIELNRKQLHFDKTLLNRTSTRSLSMRNNTALPAAWRLYGLEPLGEEFSMSQDHGIIMPKSELVLQVFFKSKKSLNLKKVVRLEVSDVDNILGTVQTENIQILAEAYDVAMDLTFPKDCDGALDFGTIKVSEEGKLSVSLKNKGKYEIAYKFELNPTLPDIPDLSTMFTITPRQGSLSPSDRPTNIHFVFCHNSEVFIKGQSIMNCEVIEPSIAEGGGTIGIIPICVSVQSVFSKYSITPSTDINFGPLVYGNRKTRTLTVENKGHFDIRFSIFRMPNDPSPAQRKSLGKRPSNESLSVKPSTMRQTQKDVGSSMPVRLNMGVFTLSPCSAIVPPGAHQMVTVDCVADQVGLWEEQLAFDITDRNPSIHPDGIPYRVLAEICMTGIECKDIASIFEEHRICKNSSMLHCEPYRESPGVYVKDENKFVFNNVLIGHSAKARFRLTNNGKVPCELSLQVKSVQSKVTTRSVEVFKLTSNKMYIPSLSHSFAVVTFTPQAIQTYHGVFEVILEGTSGVSGGKSKLLTFDLLGHGNLPYVTVMRPPLRKSDGQPVLQFKRLLVGREQRLPLVIRNTGSVMAQVTVSLLDHRRVFSLRVTPNTTCSPISTFTMEDEANTEGTMVQTSSLTLLVDQQAEFEVEFCPKGAQTYEAKINVATADNIYDETTVHVTGEGYHDIISLDNISNRAQTEEETMDVKTDLLHFGDCHVDRSYQESFTMTNLSNSDALRFEWPSDPHLHFSPQKGHLHVGCAKEVTVTFCSQQPVVLSSMAIKCRLWRIMFQEHVDQVPDWDDRHRTIRWMDIGDQKAPQQSAKRKVIETDPEPSYSVLENSSREMEIHVSAVCDFAKFTCSAEPIHFKDTMLYQTRVFQLEMVNNGNIKLEYSWQVLMDSFGKNVSQRDVTPHGSAMALRPASSLQRVSALLLGDPEVPPFTVEPSLGVIPPGANQTFQIKFSPLEVAEFEARLVCSIPNVKDGEGLSIQMSGHSLLPYCHFHLEDSDYIQRNRRNPEIQGPHGDPNRLLDPSTRVIEFSCAGIGVPTLRTFSIVNPTNKPYTFLWKCEDAHMPFSCLTSQNSIEPGKKTEITFEYCAQDLELVESFWTFHIPEHNLLLPFLLVGIAREPVIYLNCTLLDMGYILVGKEARKTVHLVNREKQPFQFSVQDTSCYSGGFQDNLHLEPMEGTLQPQDKLPVVVSLKPKQDGLATFNLTMNVKGKAEPLVMNVKAEVYSMNVCVQCEDSDGNITELMPDSVNQLNFKQVELNDRNSCAFLVSNNGRYNLDVLYELWGAVEMQQQFQVEKEKDAVGVNGHTSCTIVFHPQKQCVLKDIGISIKIKNGPEFSCSFLGSAVPPGLDFSFLKHNFGMNFIFCAGMVPATKTLVISNKGKGCVSLDCLFSNTTLLKVGFQAKVLDPGESVQIPITFYPREAKRYHEQLVFEINGCVKQVVEVLGEGIAMKLDLEDPKHKVINMGALQIGQKCKKVVALVNNSSSSLSFTLQLSEMAQSTEVLSVLPAGRVTVKGGGRRCVVELLFSPTKRMLPFNERLMLKCLDVERPLLVIKGCCQAVEVKLNQDYVPFGAVTQRCQSTRRIIMQNTGDIGARYQWDMKSFAPYFTISPSEGYICPGMDVPLDVTFKPVEPGPDLRCEGLCCAVEGCKPLKLTLTGSCILPPVTKETLNFVCQVRSQQTQSLPLTNRSNQSCTLTPAIEGNQWCGPTTFSLEPFQHNKPYELSYKPVVMTTDGNKHKGSIFFSFPDGTSLHYTLTGTAEPPKAESTIAREMPCKTQYTELVPVHNWLPKRQRFRAVVQITKPERADSTVSFKGLDFIDVPALTKKDYKITFFTYKEGQFNAKVTFVNEDTGEYLFHYLNFKATAPGVISTMKMVTTVHQTASGSVEVENPYDTSIIFTAECRNPDISVPPQLSVPSLSKATMAIEFLPLHAGESTARLTMQSAELGLFHYELLLTALPAPPEKPLYFHAQLGGSQCISAKFTNYSRAKTEYTCTIDNPDFTVEKSIPAPAGLHTGTDVSLEVNFEPRQLGEARGLLTLSSSSGGQYDFPLHGTCTLPKPQGPFTIRAGANVSIPFKNVFAQSSTFSFLVDNPAFSVKNVETIWPKKTYNIQVTFKGPAAGSQGLCNGKLTVSSPRTEGYGQSISWVYYLRGVSSEIKDKTT
ncbi:hydrocephalus-inducing protein homolog [Denticeps clupeoides]|uniref:hydrocephalus-inducing protein homolog n=1 Tax=Denticeps clupeoides TaxID=299321 RepID=UPI0010A44FDD|nr:hydrocephalus-inducing protein homolog [Denticeps clupeoides]XP_028813721.1 hydrocephalus-inducing protein homolog [Denticeps clupeoides]